MNPPTPDLLVLLADLVSSPLVGLILTLLVYVVAEAIFKRCGQCPLLHPVLLAIALLAGVLTVTGLSYERYFRGAQFVHFLLGPTTVALAIPLYFHASRVGRQFLPILLGLVCGSLTAVTSAVGIGHVLGASSETLLSLAPKSVTTPVAMGISAKIGGLPSLTAVAVILTGAMGAILAPTLLRILRIRDDGVKGLAIGVASHALGTARAFQISDMAGAYSGLALGMNALLTALLLPVLVRLFGSG